MSRQRSAGALLLSLIAAAAAAAPVLAWHTPVRQFPGYEYAPPMLPRVIHADGSLARPFVYPLRPVDRLERRFAEDGSRPTPVRWLTAGSIVSIDESEGPWLLLGGDPLGRDVFARLIYGARLSLGLACAASAGALLLGLLIGGAAGFLGGWVDRVLMTAADFVLVLPAIYVVLAIRAALPLVLTVPQVFLALTIILSVAGWPIAARGVRAIVAGERQKEYAEAALAIGAGRARILLHHLLPATTGFLATVLGMMVPAFVLTEATLSLVGLGFPIPAATWGAMLRDGWEGRAFTDAPWLMAPALLIVFTVLSLHLISSAPRGDRPRAGTFFK